MGATKRAFRRLDGVRLNLAVDGIDTITGRLPVFVVGGPDSVVPALAEALGIEDAGTFDPAQPPVFARTVKPRFRVVPAEGDPGLELHHTKRGTIQTWPVDPRVVAEATLSGQALLVLVDMQHGQQPAGLIAQARRRPVYAAWIDVLSERSAGEA
ncbi:hypothetical protein IM660_01800 [Ruania alkalisoli]|uniref:Uncharacterized protein n=1 Tax=Ruania alkalisoli TaxID=2779775 RepID=A0A7M1SVT1_9MICO|nr:hypothetical protein [Ruania alkalisoli]QOR71074.1 hypothetical protein IM660_01800 [Ruania alkalisoli]